REVSRSLSHAAGERAGDGRGCVAGFAVREPRLGPVDSDDLAGSIVDLHGADAADRDRATLLVILVTSALRAADIHGVHHRSLQRRLEESRKLVGRLWRTLVVYRSLLPAAKPLELQLHHSGSARSRTIAWICFCNRAVRLRLHRRDSGGRNTRLQSS